MNKTITTLCLSAAVLLSACVSQSTYKQEVGKADTYQRLDNQLKSEVAADQAQITQPQGLVRVTLPTASCSPRAAGSSTPGARRRWASSRRS